MHLRLDGVEKNGVGALLQLRLHGTRGTVRSVVRIAPRQRERRERQHVEWQRVVAVVVETELRRVHDAYTPVRTIAALRALPAVALSVGRSMTECCGEKAGR